MYSVVFRRGPSGQSANTGDIAEAAECATTMVWVDLVSMPLLIVKYSINPVRSGSGLQVTVELDAAVGGHGAGEGGFFGILLFG